MTLSADRKAAKVQMMHIGSHLGHVLNNGWPEFGARDDVQRSLDDLPGFCTGDRARCDQIDMPGVGHGVDRRPSMCHHINSRRFPPSQSVRDLFVVTHINRYDLHHCVILILTELGMPLVFDEPFPDLVRLLGRRHGPFRLTGPTKRAGETMVREG